MNFQELKNIVIQWFWKLGFGIGKRLGTVGQNLFGEALRAGFEMTAIESVDLGSILSTMQSNLEADVSNNITGVDVGLSGMSDSEVAKMFQGMFAEEFKETGGTMDAAKAVFSTWVKKVGTVSVSNAGSTFQEGSGPCTEYSKDGVSFVINTGDGILMIPHK